MRVDGNVLNVVANKKLSLQQIKEFVESKRSWVQSQIDSGGSLENSNNTLCEIEPDNCCNLTKNQISDIFSGKQCLLFGDVVFVRPTVETRCYLEDCIYLPEKYYAQKESRLKALNSYIKKLSQQSVSDAISRFGCNASLCPTKIEFKNLFSGWVKCTNPGEKVITLDFRVCQLPTKLQQYLIVHAFSHFTNNGHDDAFWNTVSNYLPRYKSCVEELRHYDFLKDVG